MHARGDDHLDRMEDVIVLVGMEPGGNLLHWVGYNGAALMSGRNVEVLKKRRIKTTPS